MASETNTNETDMLLSLNQTSQYNEQIRCSNNQKQKRSLRKIRNKKLPFEAERAREQTTSSTGPSNQNNKIKQKPLRTHLKDKYIST
jgi:hypothetical protein